MLPNQENILNPIEYNGPMSVRSMDSGIESIGDISSPRSVSSVYSPKSPVSSDDPNANLDLNDDYLNYPINLDKRTDIGLSDQDLVALGTKELNKKLKRNGITKKRAKELKAERRTLKNRGYAATCRVKREKEEETLEKENSELRRRIYANKIEARQIESDCEQLDKDIMQLQEEVKRYEDEYERQTNGRQYCDSGFYSDFDSDEDMEAEEQLQNLSQKNGLIVEKIYN